MAKNAPQLDAPKENQPSSAVNPAVNIACIDPSSGPIKSLNEAHFSELLRDLTKQWAKAPSDKGQG